MSKAKTKVDYDKLAAAMRETLSVSKQDQLFKAAAEAGYLASLADGNVDDGEKAAIVKALHTLSDGLVIEWEVDAMLAECDELIGAEGHQGRAAKVGAKLKELGQVDAGMLLAAYVALATSGIDKREAKMLEQIGTAAGLQKAQIAAVVKQARSALD
jgi:tellurite resistance protein